MHFPSLSRRIFLAAFLTSFLIIGALSPAFANPGSGLRIAGRALKVSLQSSHMGSIAARGALSDGLLDLFLASKKAEVTIFYNGNVAQGGKIISKLSAGELAVVREALFKESAASSAASGNSVMKDIHRKGLAKRFTTALEGASEDRQLSYFLTDIETALMYDTPVVQEKILEEVRAAMKLYTTDIYRGTKEDEALFTILDSFSESYLKYISYREELKKNFNHNYLYRMADNFQQSLSYASRMTSSYYYAGNINVDFMQYMMKEDLGFLRGNRNTSEYADYLNKNILQAQNDMLIEALRGGTPAGVMYNKFVDLDAKAANGKFKPYIDSIMKTDKPSASKAMLNICLGIRAALMDDISLIATDLQLPLY
ncbi:hypothetical protein Dip518_000404 [Parelusimicrobium proximum]